MDIEIGSDNVFEDLGYTDSEERREKACLAARINDLLKNKKWSDAKTTKILGISHQRLTLLKKGIVHKFPLGELKYLWDMLKCSKDLCSHTLQFSDLSEIPE